MTKVNDAIYGAALLFLFAAVISADKLGELPGGFFALFAMVGVAFVLILIGNRMRENRRQRRKRERRRVA